MVLLIDNYDSFVYNLYQYLSELREVKVVRNDEITIAEISALAPTHLVLSPGPGRPKDAGVLEDAVRAFAGKIPLLGVCLGHQAICEALGGSITYAKQLMHGKSDRIRLKQKSWVFRGLPDVITAARYHSLAADEGTLSKQLTITARAEDGEIMAVEHQSYRVCGLQFHPESVLSEYGMQMLKNFIDCDAGNDTAT